MVVAARYIVARFPHALARKQRAQAPAVDSLLALDACQLVDRRGHIKVGTDQLVAARVNSALAAHPHQQRILHYTRMQGAAHRVAHRDPSAVVVSSSLLPCAELASQIVTIERGSPCFPHASE